MRRLKLANRASPHERCAFCHDALGTEATSCARCRAAFHVDCRAHLATCPTLGCGAEFRDVPPEPLLVEAPSLSPRAWFALQLAGEAAAPGAFGLAAAALMLRLLVRKSDPDVSDGIILSLLVVAVFAGGVSLVKALLRMKRLRAAKLAPAEIFRMTVKREDEMVLGELRGVDDPPHERPRLVLDLGAWSSLEGSARVTVRRAGGVAVIEFGSGELTSADVR